MFCLVVNADDIRYRHGPADSVARVVWDGAVGCRFVGESSDCSGCRSTGRAVLATLDWRRRDLNPEEKGVIVVDAATGEQVTNVARFTINREKGEIVFQPQTVPGNYYIYSMIFSGL